MRRLLATVAVSGLLANVILPPVARAEPCLRPAEKMGFDVASLKSEMMVVAISCQAQDSYNRFIARFRHELQTGERSVHQYFARLAGRNASQRYDDYVTNLANVQSEEGVQQGTLFCQQHIAMFDEVMGLSGESSLAQYAQGKRLPQAMLLAACSGDK